MTLHPLARGRATSLSILLVLSACSTHETGATGRHDQADTLARRLLIADTHIDVPYRLKLEPADVGVATGAGDFDYPRARQGGLDAAFMSIFIPASADAAGEATRLADELIDSVVALHQAQPNRFVPATCPADLDRARAMGRVALPMGMENGAPLAGDLTRLAHFRERGIAYITLTHSKSNHIADSSYDTERPWGGLSPFGLTLIDAMNEQGVMIDVSHISDAAFWQVIERSRTPVIATHSSLRHFTPGFERNMDDAMVRALAGKGGVIQINFGSGFLTDNARQYGIQQQAALAEFRAANGLSMDHPDVSTFLIRYREEYPYPYASVDDVIDHIDRVVQLTGIDHVGIGSDFDGVGDTLPTGLKDVAGYPRLIEGLLRRGYDEPEIAKIMAGNLLRVWTAVTGYAATHGHPPVCQLAS